MESPSADRLQDPAYNIDLGAYYLKKQLDSFGSVELAAAAKVVGGSPMEVPDRYAEVSPASLLPIGVRQVLIHGAADFIVPSSMSNHFLTAAKAAGEPDIKLVSIAGADHFAVIEPSSSKWADVMAAILAAFQ